MRRLPVSLISALLLILAFAATPVLGHHLIDIECDEEGVEVEANIGAGHKLKVVINDITVMDEAVDGDVEDQSFFFPTSDWSPPKVAWPAEVWAQIYFPGGQPEGDPMSATVNCGEPDIDVEKTNNAAPAGVAPGTLVTYTVTVENDGSFDLNVVDVDDLLISGPGPACNPLARQTSHALAVGNGDDILEPGETWVYTCSTNALGEGTTVNEACVEAELADEELQLQDAEDEISDCDQSSVLVVKGQVGGETGTPSPLPDTAATGPIQSSPLATMVFGLLLVSSLGALAYANVRSGRR